MIYLLPIQFAYGEIKGGWGEKEYIEYTTPTIKAQLFNSGLSVSYSNSALSKITKDLYDPLSQIEYELSSEIESLLAEEIKQVSREELWGTFSYRLRSFDFNMTPIEIRLIGQGSGQVRAELEFNVSIYARARDTGPLSFIPSNISINYDSEKILFSGIYDSNSGVISALNLDVLEGKTKVSDNSIFYRFVNLFMSYDIKSILDNKLSSLKDSLNESFRGQSNTILGLNEIIPSGVLVVQNIDVGSELKSFLNNAISGKFVSLKMGRVIRHYSSGDSYRGANLMINLSNQANLHIYDHIYTYTEWVPCDPWTGICYEVP